MDLYSVKVKFDLWVDCPGKFQQIISLPLRTSLKLKRSENTSGTQAQNPRESQAVLTSSFDTYGQDSQGIQKGFHGNSCPVRFSHC